MIQILFGFSVIIDALKSAKRFSHRPACRQAGQAQAGIPLA
jgi:hypothetical protein